LNGSVSIQLPPGPNYDAFKLKIFVQIYDNLGAISVYNITTCVTVQINASSIESIVNDVLSPVSLVTTSILSSDLKSSANQILTIASLINQNTLTTVTDTVR
jgi:hypothetical protein